MAFEPAVTKFKRTDDLKLNKSTVVLHE